MRLSRRVVNPHLHARHARRRCALAIAQPTAETHAHLVRPGEVTPGIAGAEYAARRAAMASRLPRGSVALFAPAPLAYMSHDVPYPFQQAPDLHYLCGFAEPSCLLACVKRGGGDGGRSSGSGVDAPDDAEWLLFVEPSDPAQARGRISTGRVEGESWGGCTARSLASSRSLACSEPRLWDTKSGTHSHLAAASPTAQTLPPLLLSSPPAGAVGRTPRRHRRRQAAHPTRRRGAQDRRRPHRPPPHPRRDGCQSRRYGHTPRPPLRRRPKPATHRSAAAGETAAPPARQPASTAPPAQLRHSRPPPPSLPIANAAPPPPPPPPLTAAARRTAAQPHPHSSLPPRCWSGARSGSCA